MSSAKYPQPSCPKHRRVVLEIQKKHYGMITLSRPWLILAETLGRDECEENQQQSSAVCIGSHGPSWWGLCRALTNRSGLQQRIGKRVVLFAIGREVAGECSATDFHGAHKTFARAAVAQGCGQHVRGVPPGRVAGGAIGRFTRHDLHAAVAARGIDKDIRYIRAQPCGQRRKMMLCRLARAMPFEE